MNAVFKELNQGEKITSALRKVTDDMKTKNRADRVGVVPDAPTSAPRTAAMGSAVSGTLSGTVKPPKLGLEGKKWSVEHHVGKKTLVLEDVTPKQTVYVYDCHDCVITVKGKPNAITLDACKKTALVFDDVLATCELVNCRSIQVQCIGSVPTVSIDTVDGCQVYLSADASVNTSVLTAKSSEVNLVLVPGEGSDDEPVETPVPEQFITARRPDGKWTTVPFGGH
jgi:adenylyl cyclase-associated protein